MRDFQHDVHTCKRFNLPGLTPLEKRSTFQRYPRKVIDEGLLLDSRGVDFTRAYHAIFASRPLLEVIIFQGPYEGFARFRRTVEQKTLESHKSPPCKTSSQAAATTSTGSRLALIIVHGWYHSAGAARAPAISPYPSNSSPGASAASRR